MLEMFMEGFHPCKKEYHDFAGMICIKNGCPGDFVSCGPFCATEDYCETLSTGTLTKLFEITVAVTTIFATGGLALANPLQVTSIVGGMM